MVLVREERGRTLQVRMSAEKRLQDRIVAYARGKGWKVKRNYMGPGAEVGWPDLEIFMSRGRILLIEVKAPDGKLRKVQEYRIQELRALGHRAEVCDDFLDAVSIIEEYE